VRLRRSNKHFHRQLGVLYLNLRTSCFAFENVWNLSHERQGSERQPPAGEPMRANAHYVRRSILLDVCVLSYGEARQLEHRNEWPQCKHHQHVKKREAAEMVAADTHRFIGGNNTRLNHPVSMITPVAIREWRPVPTAGLLGFRTWGLSQTK